MSKATFEPNNVLHNNDLQDLLTKYIVVFGKVLGACKRFQAKFLVEADVVPRFQRARTVLYYFRDRIYSYRLMKIYRSMSSVIRIKVSSDTQDFLTAFHQLRGFYFMECDARRQDR